MELPSTPHFVDKFYIDGPIDDDESSSININPATSLLLDWGPSKIPISVPSNPHSGCFFLSSAQLKHWCAQDYWLDRSSNFISPLESAATLGLAKTFSILKPDFSHCSWFEVQHFGTSFHSLIQSPG